MKIAFKHKLALFAGTLALLLILANPGGHVYGQDAGYSEEEAQSIDRMLICPVCPAESIDQAQVEIARQMRAVVREMLAQGASRDEILDFFVARYGTDVLAAPPKSGANLLVWILPIAGIIAALAGGFLIIRSMSSRSNGQVVAAAMPPVDPGDAGLAPYLEAVDRDLALLGDGGSTGPPPVASERTSDGTSGRTSGRTFGRASNQDEEGVGKLREPETNQKDGLERNG